jgi:hypothetical protein
MNHPYMILDGSQLLHRLGFILVKLSQSVVLYDSCY